MNTIERIKVIGMVVTLGSLLGVLSACQESEKTTAIVQRDQNGTKTELLIFTDVQTGCQYVRTWQRAGITPRLDKDGKPMCGEVRR